MEVITSKPGTEKKYKFYIMGLYIVIETYHGMTFMWDEKTTVIVQVAPSFQVGENIVICIPGVFLCQGQVNYNAFSIII